MKYICVFCGSRVGRRPAYKLAAIAMGEALARRGLGLVYGGGNIGLMGIVADAALAAGGEVIGVIPEFLLAKEIAHPGLSKLHIVKSMHDRKALMADLSDASCSASWGIWNLRGIHRDPNLGAVRVTPKAPRLAQC